MGLPLSSRRGEISPSLIASRAWARHIHSVQMWDTRIFTVDAAYVCAILESVVMWCACVCAILVPLRRGVCKCGEDSTPPNVCAILDCRTLCVCIRITDYLCIRKGEYSLFCAPNGNSICNVTPTIQTERIIHICTLFV